MTAEQALIQENKKDPRVRYITTHNTCTDFWSEKPFFNGVQWIGVIGSLIKSNDYLVDFGNRESLIICIDDIKPEVPPIPEKWYIECTEENRDILNNWRLKRATGFINDKCFLVSSGCSLISNDVYRDGGFYSTKNQIIPQEYKKITLEQFKKYVLKSEENQEEIQEPNYSLDCTDSYEKSGSIGSVEFSGKYIKTGRIISADMNADTFASTNNDIYFEFYDIRCWIEDRINYINQFIKRTIDSDLCINPEWISERNELIEKIKNL